MSADDNKAPRGNTWEREVDDDGEFVRKPTTFRSWIRADGSSGFPPESGRYHLYVSYACPWAHRTLIMRKLKGLEHAISFDVVDAFLPAVGWTFEQAVPGATGDSVHDFHLLREVYTGASPDFDGTITVPVLYDKKQSVIVNNESADIIRMLNSEFQEVAAHPELDFYPQALREQIDELNDWIYPTVPASRASRPPTIRRSMGCSQPSTGRRRSWMSPVTSAEIG